MTDFDTRLRTALSVDDEEFLKNLEDERGMFTQFTATLNGPMAVWTWLMSFFVLIFAGAAIYSGWQLLQAEATRPLILWAMAFLFSLNAVTMMKMWMFDRMNTVSILREVKRLELRIAQLAMTVER
jgi:hypothetical protein